jgi:hypothetical protein
VALDLRGRVRVAEIDRAGWNVISTRDFASPHLSRLVQPAETALRGTEATGVVMSDPLTTQPPSMVRPSAELARVFRDVERTATQDITPIMARDSNLRAEDALRLVQPTTYQAVARRSAASASAASGTSAPRATAPGAAAGATTPRPVLSSEPSSPLSRGAVGRSPQSARPPAAAGTRSPSVNEAAANPFVPRSRPASSLGTAGGQATTPILRGGSLSRSTTGAGSAYRAPVSRVVPPSAGGRAQGPVIVPRSATSRTSPGVRSGSSAPRNPTASTRAPSSAPRSGGSVGGSAPRSGGSGGGSAPRAASGAHRR